MDFFDFIRELRKGEPNIKKSEKAMKILGWICVVGAVWNFVIYYIAPFKEGPFNLPPHYPYLALISLSLLGVLFFLAARGIKEMVPWGKKLGQLAVVLLIGIVIGFMFFIFPIKVIPLSSDTFSIIFFLFFALCVAQFVFPAYFGVRYLGRLPVKESNYTNRFKLDNRLNATNEEISRESLEPQIKYKDALLPFGIVGTFALLIAVPLLIILIIEKYVGQESIFFIFMPSFLVIFFGSVVYNYVPSPFQKERDLVASYTGAGWIFLFSGTWPFFRLMVYSDGVEIRVMFHRYFIPYDKMDNIPEKVGFFNRGLLIKSDLPGVPSGIRFVGFGMKKILKVVNNLKNQYLAQSRR